MGSHLALALLQGRLLHSQLLLRIFLDRDFQGCSFGFNMLNQLLLAFFLKLANFNALKNRTRRKGCRKKTRSEEHTSELQSHSDIVCRLLLEKKKIQYNMT